MIKSLRAVALGALALATASPALAQTGAVSKSGPAEIPCVAVGLIWTAGAGDHEGVKQTGTLYTLYFYGRVRSAMSEAEVHQRLTATLNDLNQNPDDVEAQGIRCNALLDQSAVEIDNLNKALEAQE